MRRTITAIATWLMTSWLGLTAAAEDSRPRTPYVPTPDRVIHRMLDLAQVGPDDHVMDLGSGDGRIVIQAALRGASAQGVEIKPSLVLDARANAGRAGVGDRVTFVEQDLDRADIRHASVVMLYLMPLANAGLWPKLRQQLRPGARVVSHGFGFVGWDADETIEVELEGDSPRTVFLWVMPAEVAGRWQWSVDGHRFDWQVQQRFRALDTTLWADGVAVTPTAVDLHGCDLAFVIEHEGERYAFSGRVEGDRIEGTVQVDDGERRGLLPWRAHGVTAIEGPPPESSSQLS